MVSYTATAILAVAAVASAQAYGAQQNQTQTDCYIKYNQCRGAKDANFSFCASQFASCLGFNPFNSEGTNTVTPSYTLPAVASTTAAATGYGTPKAQCDAKYDQCRGAPDANFAYCGSQYAGCLGYNPFTASATTTTSAPAVSTSSTKAQCDDAYNKCRTAPDANFAYCGSQYAGCLGYNPFTQSADSYVTKTVTDFTTVCPSPTTFVHGPSTYTVTSSTVITVKCPTGCVVTTPAPKPTETHPAPPAETHPAPPAETHPAPPAETHPAPPAGTHPAPPPAPPAGTTAAPPPLTTVTRGSQTATSTRAVFTGAAAKVGGSGALLVGALGFLAL